MAKRPLSPPIVGELLSLMNASGFSYEPRTNAGFGESLYSLYHSDMKIREVIPRGCIREFIDGWNLAIKHFNLRSKNANGIVDQVARGEELPCQENHLIDASS